MNASSEAQPANALCSDHSWCTCDRVASGFGIVLLITGLALFIIRGSHLASASIFYGSAPAAFTGVGTSIFCLSFLANACVRGCTALGTTLGEAVNQREDTKNAIDTRNQTQPVPLTTSTKDFFESKGIFGLPRELIELLDEWRAFRLGLLTEPPVDAGCLLCGPPGCGKTRIAELVGELLGGIYVPKKSGDLQSTMIGGTERAITNLFQVPKDEFRVIFIDEMDGFLPKRTGDNSSVLGSVHRVNDQNVSHLLSTVTGNISGNEPRRYMFMGATNRRNAIDPAILRDGRLGIVIPLNRPTLATIQEILTFYLRGIEIKKTNSDDYYKDREKNELLMQISTNLFELEMSGSAVVAALKRKKNKAIVDGHPQVIYYEQLSQDWVVH